MNDLHLYTKRFFTFRFLSYDLPAGLVVFLVALPLCLGIALASGAPLFAGLLTGIVGGMVVSLLSGSQLSVSGPAAGLTVIVLNAIATLGSFEAFLLAVTLAGAIQLIMGFLRAGVIANYFPSSVIKGMLAAIGIILIMKQLPHAVGYDADYEGDFAFLQADKENSFSELINILNKINPGAAVISIISIAIMLLWPRISSARLKMIPAGLLVVITGIVLNIAFKNTALELRNVHLVNIPSISSLHDARSVLHFPDFSQFGNPAIYVTAITLAIVASLETLLSIEAVDKLDPLKRVSHPDAELKAQGIGNMVAGLLGGLPMTAVIVRSSANVQSGGKTKLASFVHGCLLLIAVILLPSVINRIPLAALASILLITGYKLAGVPLFREMYRSGRNQFIPFVITIAAIVFTDLLKGIAIGMVVGIFFILRRNMKNPYFFHKEEYHKGEPVHLVLSEDVSFLNKASILTTLEEIPEEAHVIIDGSQSRFIDYDVLEIIENFKENAIHRDIKVDLVNINRSYEVVQE